MRRPAAVALLALALSTPAPAAARDTPALLVPPALGRPELAWIAGRVLAETQGKHGPSALRTARALSASNLEGAEVEVTFLGRTARGVSGHDGEFLVTIPRGDGPAFPVGASPAEIRAAGARATAIVHVIDPAAPFLLVTDFDDTVAVTNVTRPAGAVRTTFLEDAETQGAVPGMAALYRCLVAREGAAPAPAVAFLSGSPVQLAPRLVRFLEKNGFPPAALFLRNLGPGTLTGYKEPVLRTLLARFPHRLVLVGDTGERDPEIYAALAREFPDRVLRVYLRRATPTFDGGRAGEGTLVFSEPAAAAHDAAARGLADAACVERAFPTAKVEPRSP
jgi:phosphatidate phosphatase APP1